MIRKVTKKEFKIKLALMKNKNIDGRLVVAILDTILQQASRIRKQLNKELKKKVPDPKVLHRLNIESKAYRNLVEEMIVNIVSELTKINLEKLNKRKRHAKVGRK